MEIDHLLVENEKNVHKELKCLVQDNPQIAIMRNEIREHVGSNLPSRVFIPYTSTNGTFVAGSCKGCKMQFKKLRNVFEPAYYTHCIMECDKYKKLNLIKECIKCEKLFLNRRSVVIHKCGSSRPAKPDWMSVSTYQKSLGHFKPESGKFTSCLGCQKEFHRGLTKQKSSYQYLVHCIEDCDKYKELNLIRECNECNYKFLNSYSSSHHETRYHSKRPVWMAKNTYQDRNQKRVWNQVPCLGCGRMLNYCKKNQACMVKDYIHMIEECHGYKKHGMIRECKKCKCKFINNRAICAHKCFSG